VGVTVIVAIIGVVPALVAVNPAIFPVPFAANPIAVLVLAHAIVAPAGVLTKFVAATDPLLHTTILAGTVTLGVGFTVIVYVDGVPDIRCCWVTVIVAIIGVVPALVAVNPTIFPVPFAASPIAVLLFVQA